MPNQTPTHTSISPGRELDALVESNVMQSNSVVVPPYSTNISMAWRVVEKVRSSNVSWSIESTGDEWCAQLWSDAMYEKPGYSQWEVIAEAYHKSAPHAICLAALKAVKHV